MKRTKVLVADDDRAMSFFLTELMNSEGYSVIRAFDGPQALELIQKESPDVVLLDVRLPGMGGLEVLRRSKERGARSQFIVITAYDTKEMGLEAIRLGAFDYFPKPLDKDEVRIVVRRAVWVKGLEEENLKLRAQRESRSRFGGLIGSSKPMKDLYEQMEMLLEAPVTVLITGESGTGKELVAEALHYMGPRREKPFVKINCVAIPDTLLESELFGHERGAFTGATERRIGKLERANGGSVLLDEIGDMGISIQGKLLRFLQEHKVERLGGSSSIHVDVRVMASTNCDLQERVKEGRFREDLYYRLNVVNLKLPPLRERLEDIPSLVEHFLEKYGHSFGKTGIRMGEEAMQALLEYDWPGNVRELENVIQRAVVLCKEATITSALLPEHVKRGRLAAVKETPLGEDGSLDLNLQLERAEREIILEALRRTGGKRKEAARLLNITRQTLHTKMVKYGLEHP